MASPPLTASDPVAHPGLPALLRLPGRGSAEDLIHFGDAHWAAQPIAQDPLTPPVEERWIAPGPVHRARVGRFTVSRSPDYQFACTEVPVTRRSMREQTMLIYRELMALIEGSEHRQLLRFWNYVPWINEGQGDHEVYRQFCWGRADALSLDHNALPAATAIGSADGVLRISALTASPRVTVTHIENPRQVSAYHYPREYGPRSPSFARATRVTFQGDALLLLSGTASIVSHETRHPDDLAAQTAETHRNIQSLLGVATGGDGYHTELLRIYLRSPEQLEEALSCYHRTFDGFP
ncbi:MAG: hypothetical protein AAGI15_15925, partial [Pseudomonadota bacterium]